MKYITLILAVLIAIPALALAGDDGVLLTDKSSKALFKMSHTQSEPHRMNDSSEKGDYFTTKFRKGFIAVWYNVKRAKDIINIDEYQSVSIDVRVRNSIENDYSTVFVNFWKANGRGFWEALISRTDIPNDGKKYRVVIPVAQFVPIGNPTPTDKTEISKLAFGVKSELEHETVITDVGNVILWKKTVAEVQVIPLEK